MKKAKMNLFLTLFVVCFLTQISARASLQIKSTFDTGTDGWTENEGGTLSYFSSGGNPGGHLQVADADAIPDYGLYAPPRFLGNLTAFDGGTLSFDWKVVASIDGACSDAQQWITISGPAGTAQGPVPTPVPPVDWTTVEIPLTTSVWNKTEDQWRDILANVTNIFVEFEIYCGPDTMGFDNFALTANCPSASIRLSEVEVCWPSISNATYRIDYRSDLTTNAWLPLFTNTAVAQATCVTDRVPRGAPQRFYRVTCLE